GNILLVQNTIVAGNLVTSNGHDIWGLVSSASSYNLVGLADSSLSGISNGVNHNQIGTAASPINPRLSPLGFYGGPTRTFALLPNRPARNAGNPVGAPRPTSAGSPGSSPGRWTSAPSRPRPVRSW